MQLTKQDLGTFEFFSKFPKGTSILFMESLSVPVLPLSKTSAFNLKGNQYYLVLIFFAHLSKAKHARYTLRQAPRRVCATKTRRQESRKGKTEDSRGAGRLFFLLSLLHSWYAKSLLADNSFLVNSQLRLLHF